VYYVPVDDPDPYPPDITHYLNAVGPTAGTEATWQETNNDLTQPSRCLPLLCSLLYVDFVIALSPIPVLWRRRIAKAYNSSDHQMAGASSQWSWFPLPSSSTQIWHDTCAVVRDAEDKKQDWRWGCGHRWRGYAGIIVAFTAHIQWTFDVRHDRLSMEAIDWSTSVSSRIQWIVKRSSSRISQTRITMQKKWPKCPNALKLQWLR